MRPLGEATTKVDVNSNYKSECVGPEASGDRYDCCIYIIAHRHIRSSLRTKRIEWLVMVKQDTWQETVGGCLVL